MADRFEEMQAFSAVADHGAFAEAARALRISPAGVTRAVAALEARLGARLLHRTTRAVRLTEEGTAFLPRCRRVLADLREAEELVSGTRPDPHGTIVATAPVVLGRMHVVPIVTALLARHARLAVRLVLVDRVVQLVEEGIDVAVRIGELPDSSLKSRRLGEVRRVLVASPDYLDARGTPAEVADLRRHSIVAFTGVSPSDDWRFGTDERTGVQVKPRLVLNGADAAIEAALRGAGICRVLSYQVRRELEEGRLRTVLDAHAPPPVPLTVLFDAARAGSPSVRAFLGAAREHFARAPL